MQARVYGQNGEYTVYSVEHEPVSSSLSILKPLVSESVLLHFVIAFFIFLGCSIWSMLRPA